MSDWRIHGNILQKVFHINVYWRNSTNALRLQWEVNMCFIVLNWSIHLNRTSSLGFFYGVFFNVSICKLITLVMFSITNVPSLVFNTFLSFSLFTPPGYQMVWGWNLPSSVSACWQVSITGWGRGSAAGDRALPGDSQSAQADRLNWHLEGVRIRADDRFPSKQLKPIVP